jgi:uroporphyrinogen-III synthase
MRVLITRPIEDATATAELLRALRHEPVVAPFLEIRYRAGVEIPSDAHAVLATSANGVRALAKNTARRDFRVFAVGAQTAQAARHVGFADVASADGDAADLAKLVVTSGWPKDATLLHAAGAQTRGDLADALQHEGFHVRTVTLYDAIAAEELPCDLATIDAALFFSPRSATIFAGLARDVACAKILACCISAATADALRSLQMREVRVAARPNQESLLALVR